MSAPQRVVLGIDGGGTKTVARLVTVAENGEAVVLGSGYGGGSNPYSVGWEAAEEAVTRAVSSARSEAPGASTPELAVLAIAGCATPASRDRLADWAAGQDWAQRALIVPDTAPILADAPDGEPAVGLIAGTGSSALAKSRDGAVCLVGGWGYLIDDGGSGYALGRDALAYVARLDDERHDLVRNPFAAAVLSAAGATDAAGLKPLLYQSTDPRGWTASLARAVVTLAGDGDAAAVAIVERGATALADLAVSAAARAAPDERNRPALFLSGGLLGEGSAYRGFVHASLASAGWSEDRVRDAPDAATACARLAVRQISP